MTCRHGGTGKRKHRDGGTCSSRGNSSSRIRDLHTEQLHEKNDCKYNDSEAKKYRILTDVVTCINYFQAQFGTKI